MTSEPGHQVKRRKVFYVSGFDPKGASGYYDMYLKESAKQAQLSGMTINVGPRQRRGRSIADWQIKASADGCTVETEYSFLRWDDIIRANWPRGSFRLFGLSLITYWSYIRSGVLRRVLANSWPAFICANYPILAMLLTALVSLFMGVMVGWLMTVVTDLPAWIKYLVAVPIALELYRRLIRLVDDRLEIHWIARIYLFSLKQSARRVEGYEDRIDQLSEVVADAINNDEFDEVLIVGHSTGAQTAVSILDRALSRAEGLSDRRAQLSLLTLGGSIPMLSWQPDAGWFRKELQRVAECESLDWLDFTAAQDGACFALHDPVSSSGLNHPENQEPKPKLLSIKLFDLFSQERFKEIRRSWGKVHFQYLLAGEQQAEYDYFAITAGSKSLADRFAHRPSAVGFDQFKLGWLGD